MAKNIVRTQVRFTRLMEELDTHRETLVDLGGEYNEIQDSENEDTARMDEIDEECEALEEKVEEIRVQLGLPEDVFERHTQSYIMNRWEVYCSLMGGESISLVDIAAGRV
jgi:predicted nuclease with TOPRIM domain